MINELIDWIRLHVLANYEYSLGMWVDTPALAERFICAFRKAGGPAPVVDVRRERFQIILLGPKNRRESVGQLISDADRLVNAAIAGSVPCKAANIRAITEIVGPGYTAENRPWVQIDFEVLT